ncbi:flavin reductase family protein [Nanoarchaeota archaeon]
MRDIVNPRQVVLVTVHGKADIMGKEVVKDNIITLTWHCPLSFDPELYGICIGKNRFSYQLIKESKVFCVNFVPYSMKEAAIQCGTSSGANVDKFEKYGLTKEGCEVIDCCAIKEALATLACEVVDEFETGDHVFFVGKVVRKMKREDDKRLFHIGGSGFTSNT